MGADDIGHAFHGGTMDGRVRDPREVLGQMEISASTRQAPANVLLVEDDPACARRLAAVLGRTHAQVQVFHALSLKAARALMAQHRFDWALVDVHLPDGSGLALLAELAQQQPGTECVVVSAWGHTDTVVSAIRTGARGYLLKSADDDHLAQALASLRDGGAPIDPLVAARILAVLAALPVPFKASMPVASPTAPQGGEGPCISAREMEILQYVARGDTNREIAQALGLSVLTVASHTRSIYRKLAVRSRTAAVVQAQAQGWL